MCTGIKGFLNNCRETSVIVDTIITNNPAFVKEKRKAAAKTAAGGYFLRKDLQSVHWSMAGFCSWVPTRILSREQ